MQRYKENKTAQNKTRKNKIVFFRNARNTKKLFKKENFNAAC